MSVDLSNLEEGDTVVFRSGGEEVVKHKYRGCSEGITMIGFPSGHHDAYYFDGRYKRDVECHHDIVEIFYRPFNWKNVKRGMAFRSPDDPLTLYYVGDCLCPSGEDNGDDAVFCYDIENKRHTVQSKHKLKRSNKIDIKE